MPASQPAQRQGKVCSGGGRHVCAVQAKVCKGQAGRQKGKKGKGQGREEGEVNQDPKPTNQTNPNQNGILYERRCDPRLDRLTITPPQTWVGKKGMAGHGGLSPGGRILEWGWGGEEYGMVWNFWKGIDNYIWYKWGNVGVKCLKPRQVTTHHVASCCCCHAAMPCPAATRTWMGRGGDRGGRLDGEGRRENNGTGFIRHNGNNPTTTTTTPSLSPWERAREGREGVKGKGRKAEGQRRGTQRPPLSQSTPSAGSRREERAERHHHQPPTTMQVHVCQTLYPLPFPPPSSSHLPSLIIIRARAMLVGEEGHFITILPHKTQQVVMLLSIFFFFIIDIQRSTTHHTRTRINTRE